MTPDEAIRRAAREGRVGVEVCRAEGHAVVRCYAADPGGILSTCSRCGASERAPCGAPCENLNPVRPIRESTRRILPGEAVKICERDDSRASLVVSVSLQSDSASRVFLGGYPAWAAEGGMVPLSESGVPVTLGGWVNLSGVFPVFAMAVGGAATINVRDEPYPDTHRDAQPGQIARCRCGVKYRRPHPDDVDAEPGAYFRGDDE